MKKSAYTYLLLLIVSFLTINSCINDVDFDQADDFSISPVLTSSLFFFDTPSEVFIIDPGDTNAIIDTLTNIGIFEDDFVVDNLIRAEFLFEVTNSINREFEAQVNLLNRDLELQHTFTISVPASPQNQEQVTEFIEIFEGDTLDALKASTEILFTLTLVPDISLPDVDENTPGRLRLRSVGTFFLNIGDTE